MKRLYGLLLLLIFSGCHYVKSPEMRLCSRLDWQSIVTMFPKNEQQIGAMKLKAIAVIDTMLKTLESQEPQHRNFYNSIRLYDNAKFKFIMNLQILSTVSMLDSDPSLRSCANNAVTELQQYQADKLVRNPILLHAFQDYAQYGHDDPSKTISVRTFLQKSINKLEHEGAHLSPAILARLNKLSKDIKRLEAEFGSYIVNHAKSIVCTKDELVGVPALYLTNLHQTKRGYTIPLTYDSFFTILENCTIAATRKKIFLEFNRRVYPKNEDVLKKLIYKRNEYARLVGYKNFAEYECALQMVGSVQRAQDFIMEIVASTNTIVDEEFVQLTKNLPESVVVSSTGKLQPFDEAFVRSTYRKNHFDIDATALAQYFPIDNVINQLTKQFGQFFALSFDQVPCHGLWHKDLICFQVRLLKTNEILGYLVFDLYARPGKSEQACQMSVIPTIQDDCSFACSGLSTIITNFNKAQDGKKTLLEFHDVKTLFHEFGHALQELFGATDFVDIAGSHGPRDFLEVPSQLFEMWMDNPSMIKQFSQHYITQEKLSDAMVQKIVAAEKFGRASLLSRQCLLSLISLEFGKNAEKIEPHDIVEKLYRQVRTDVEYCPQDHFETGFEHLIAYGSHYYGYVWSKVLAAGLFEYITKHGITDNEVGQKLYQALLCHGGSQDPQKLVELLLGSTVTKKALIDSLQS